MTFYSSKIIRKFIIIVVFHDYYSHYVIGDTSTDVSPLISVLHVTFFDFKRRYEITFVYY